MDEMLKFTFEEIALAPFAGKEYKITLCTGERLHVLEVEKVHAMKVGDQVLDLLLTVKEQVRISGQDAVITRKIKLSGIVEGF